MDNYRDYNIKLKLTFSYNFFFVINCIQIGELTVHEVPPCSDTTENCIACGRASSSAVTQIAKMNLTARDSLDMVCCLQLGDKGKMFTSQH